jgi:SAM-dependent methyltransferase
MSKKGSPLLPLIKVSPAPPQEEKIPLSRHARKKMYSAATEKTWQEYPQKYLPHRHALDTLRIERSWSLLSPFLPLEDSWEIVDIGCGFSPLSPDLLQHHLTYVDSSRHALEKPSPGKKIHDALPLIKLDDDHYDLVICTDVIAELAPQDHRLAVGEMARLVKKDGVVLISTPLDIDSIDALERFLALVDTEFIIIDSCISHHRLVIRLLRALKKPGKWWKPLAKIFSPLANKVSKNKKWILFLEKMALFLWDQEAVSHVIVVAKRKALL